MIRVMSVFFVSLLFISCGSSSVYQLPEQQQKGLTYQTYQQSPDKTFGVVTQVLQNHGSDLLMDEGWEIESSNEQAGTIETSWRTAGGSESVSGGRTMGSSSDERYKIDVEITEEDSGSRVSFRLHKQVKMSEWRTFDVKQETAQDHLQPLFNKLKEEGLTQ